MTTPTASGTPAPFHAGSATSALQARAALGDGHFEVTGATQGLGPAVEIARDTLLAFLSSVDGIDVLTPACSALRLILDAVEGAAANKDDLRELLDLCLGITHDIFTKAQVANLPPGVQKQLDSFTNEVEAVAATAQTVAGASRARRCMCHGRDRRSIDSHRERLMKLWTLIIGGATLDTNMRLAAMWNAIIPSALPEMAKVPIGTPNLPSSYVERVSLVRPIVDSIIGDNCPAHVLFGMGGGGKSVLASAIIRHQAVREHFRQGIFWITAGAPGMNTCVELLLQGLARDLGNAATDRPHAVPREFADAEEIIQHLSKVRADGDVRCLVVIDNVWEMDIISAFGRIGFNLLVTTRNRSTVAAVRRASFTEVGDMAPEEAQELLRDVCGAPPMLELPTEAVLQVARDCGLVALALALAGPLLKGPPQDPDSWRRLHDIMAGNMATSRGMAVQARVHAVLEVSFGAMADDPNKMERCKYLAVLAPGILASPDMLEQLWDEAPGAARTFAQQLVSESVLQQVGEAYQVHDLVLNFLEPKLNVRNYPGRLAASSRMAEYLGKLQVLRRYCAGAGSESLGDVYSLIALWNSVEKFSDENHRAGAVYTRALRGVAERASWYDAGKVLLHMDKHAEAEIFCRHTIELATKEHGDGHPEVATALNNTAEVLREQGKNKEASALYRRAIAIDERVYGPNHSRLGICLNNLAMVLITEGSYTEADELCERAISIGEGTLGPDHPSLAARLNNKAVLLEAQGKYDAALAVYERSLTIDVKTYGHDHPEVATNLHNQAGLLRAQNKFDEAMTLYERSRAIFEKYLGPDHRRVGVSLTNQAELLRMQGKYAEAETLFLRALEILEKTLGGDHPNVAVSLNNLANLFSKQGKFDDAGPLYDRAVAIGEKMLGPSHPDLAIWLNNKGGFLSRQGKRAEAEPFYTRSLAMLESIVGVGHPDVARMLESRTKILEDMPQAGGVLP